MYGPGLQPRVSSRQDFSLFVLMPKPLSSQTPQGFSLPGVSKAVRHEEERVDEGVNPNDAEVI